jgi:hypothetical protein
MISALAVKLVSVNTLQPNEIFNKPPTDLSIKKNNLKKMLFGPFSPKN